MPPLTREINRDSERARDWPKLPQRVHSRVGNQIQIFQPGDAPGVVLSPAAAAPGSRGEIQNLRLHSGTSEPQGVRSSGDWSTQLVSEGLA